MNNESIKKYCVGCGLCKAYNKAHIEIDKKGFYHPVDFNYSWLNAVCPVAGNQCKELSKTDIWGRKEGVYIGWSANKDIRHSSSSGGMLTSIAIFLLEKNIVDAIIHIGEDVNDPTRTQCFLSYSRDEIIKRAGSRYAISHPLECLSNIDLSKKYALIGKPCDITAVRNAMTVIPNLQKSIIITLSFFCMGLPSTKAQDMLLESLKVKKDECFKLNYRGEGWPGLTTAYLRNGSKKSISYRESWGQILGRDLMPACRFCADGLGEMADISCGDCWYIDREGKPDFSEHEGRNVIFARTKLGLSILKQMQNDREIIIHDFTEYKSVLFTIQSSQFYRRALLKSRIAALKLFDLPHPQYSKELLDSYSKNVSFKEKVLSFAGTCRRIIKRKI